MLLQRYKIRHFHPLEHSENYTDTCACTAVTPLFLRHNAFGIELHLTQHNSNKTTTGPETHWPCLSSCKKNLFGQTFQTPWPFKGPPTYRQAYGTEGEVTGQTKRHIHNELNNETHITLLALNAATRAINRTERTYNDDAGHIVLLPTCCTVLPVAHQPDRMSTVFSPVCKSWPFRSRTKWIEGLRSAIKTNIQPDRPHIDDSFIQRWWCPYTTIHKHTDSLVKLKAEAEPRESGRRVWDLFCDRSLQAPSYDWPCAVLKEVDLFRPAHYTRTNLHPPRVVGETAGWGMEWLGSSDASCNATTTTCGVG